MSPVSYVLSLCAVRLNRCDLLVVPANVNFLFFFSGPSCILSFLIRWIGATGCLHVLRESYLADVFLDCTVQEIQCVYYPKKHVGKPIAKKDLGGKQN